MKIRPLIGRRIHIGRWLHVNQPLQREAWDCVKKEKELHGVLQKFYIFSCKAEQLFMGISTTYKKMFAKFSQAVKWYLESTNARKGYIFN